MFECPNCGGNLKFDISSQQLKCDYCLTTYDPYDISKKRDAEESTNFDVTIFTCPQCGGEILSTDTSAAEFCSFCGASTILTSRISNERKPARIIPFKQTKDACKKAYLAKMKKAVFAPRELKDEKYIESFRGIYMPYWVYNISQQGTVYLNGQKSYRRGNYRYTDYYSLSGDLDASYNDLSYDASSSFSDSISEKLAPYNIKDQKEFTPSFLSGFYADTADVASNIYQEDALKIANDTSFNKIKNTSAFSGITVTTRKNSNINGLLGTSCHASQRVMYPVWFMSYRKGDRVAYAAVNGQSGKVAADIPIDTKKYVLGSLLLAIPIFIMLNLLYTLKPTTVLNCSALLAVITFIIYLIEVSKIYHRDMRHDDRGYLYQQNLLTPTGKMKAKVKTQANTIPFKELLTYSLLGEHMKIPGFTGSLSAVFICGILWLWNPVADYWFYGGAAISFLGVLLTIMAIICKYNILVTQELPQFNRKGGDDRA